MMYNRGHARVSKHATTCLLSTEELHIEHTWQIAHPVKDVQLCIFDLMRNKVGE